jgi:hypothetical protein
MFGSLLATCFTPFPALALTTTSMHVSAQSTLCLQPPQQTNLLTLSDAELASYGLPSHAVISESPAFWSTALAHAHHRTCSTGPSSIKKHGASPHVTSHDKLLINNNVWADNEAVGSRGTYRAATVEFTVPTLSLSNSSADVAIWTGVGGDNNRDGGSGVLPQVGIVANASGNDGCNDHQYNESVWELAGAPNDNGAVNLPLSRLCIGDQVYAYVSSNLETDGYNYYYIENETTGSYNSHTQSGSGTYFSDSATGECVVERVTNGLNQLDPLAEFNPSTKTEEINNCEIINSSGAEQSVGNWSHIAYQITNSSGTVLAYPGPLDSTGQNFPVHWQQSS